MKFYVGKVENNVHKDEQGNPTSSGMIQIRTSNQSNAATKDLQWHRKADIAQGMGYGSCYIPPVNSLVLCFCTDTWGSVAANYYYLCTLILDIDTKTKNPEFPIGKLRLKYNGYTTPSNYTGNPNNAIIYQSPKGSVLEFSDFLSEDDKASEINLVNTVGEGLYLEGLTKKDLPGGGRRFDIYNSQYSKASLKAGATSSLGSISNTLVKQETTTEITENTNETNTNGESASSDVNLDGDVGKVIYDKNGNPIAGVYGLESVSIETQPTTKVKESKKKEENTKKTLNEKATKAWRDGVKKGMEKLKSVAANLMDKAFASGMSIVANTLRGMLGDEAFNLAFPYIASGVSVKYNEIKDKSLTRIDQITQGKKSDSKNSSTSDSGSSTSDNTNETSQEEGLAAEYIKNNDFYYYNYIPCKYGEQYFGITSNSMPLSNSVGLNIKQQSNGDTEYIIPKKSIPESESDDVFNGGLFYNNSYRYLSEDGKESNGFTSFTSVEDCFKKELFSTATVDTAEKTAYQKMLLKNNFGANNQSNVFNVESYSTSGTDTGKSSISHILNLMSSFEGGSSNASLSLNFKGTNSNDETGKDISEAYLKYESTVASTEQRPVFSTTLGVYSNYKDISTDNLEYTRDSSINLDSTEKASIDLQTKEIVGDSQKEKESILSLNNNKNAAVILRTADIKENENPNWFELSMNDNENKLISITAVDAKKDSKNNSYSGYSYKGDIQLSRDKLELKIEDKEGLYSINSYTNSTISSEVYDKNNTCTTSMDSKSFEVKSGDYSIKLDSNDKKVSVYAGNSEKVILVIENGKVTIDGDLTVTGTITGNTITGKKLTDGKTSISNGVISMQEGSKITGLSSCNLLSQHK